MPELLLKLAGSLNSSVFILLALLAVAFWAMYKIGGFTTTFSVFKEKNKHFEASITTIKNDLSEIKATTKLLYDAGLQTVRSHSPISLTAKGESIATETSLKQKVDDHWSDIKEIMNEKSPTNPYDIQSISMDVGRVIFDTIFSEDEKNEIKNYAYKTGENLLQITPIIGVFIRDRYLQESGIHVDEVDQHDPAKAEVK